MARNRSEKLTSCPEAIAYADWIEELLLSGDRPDSEATGQTRWELYAAIPYAFRTKISDARRDLRIRNTADSLAFNVKYIRENYAA